MQSQEEAERFGKRVDDVSTLTGRALITSLNQLTLVPPGANERARVREAVRSRIAPHAGPVCPLARRGTAPPRRTWRRAK